MSKPMLVTLPFVLLLLDYWPLNRLSSPMPGAPRSSFRARLPLFLEKAPFLLLAAATCVVTVLVQKSDIKSIQSFGFPMRIGNASVAYATYLWQMLYPVGLAVFYPYPDKHLSVGEVGLSVLVLLIVSVGVLAGRRKHPYLLMGWLWYLGMLVPVIGLIQVGDQARADRYTYLPQIGLYVLMTWGAVAFCGSWRYRRAVLRFAAMAVLVGLLVGAYVQTSYWKDSVSLWTHTLACTESPLAHYNLGDALAAQGKRDEAIPHFKQAIQLKPDYAAAYYNLGNALASQGELAEAIQYYQQALQLRPDSYEAHYNLGNALAGQGKLAEAIQHYEQALQLHPDYADAHNNLGNALAGRGRLAEAIQHYERALQLHPEDAQVHYNLGIALATQGRANEAILHFQQALALATAQGDTALAESIRTRLKSYPPALPQPQTP
jgi:tetratricopeptide (TPR) repeat protein